MEREQIIRMAREAGIPIEIDWAGRPSTLVVKDSGTYLRGVDDLEHFAALVISYHDKANRPKPDASEREWLQQIAYQHGGIGDLCQTEFEFGAMVAAAERNAILQMSRDQWFKTQADFEAAIRARGQG